jgi:glycyl-tRNA synthetase beta chain (EC 6.1.1.14)
MAAARQYSESLARLAALRDPVDAFFEAVMVNAEDAKVRVPTVMPCSAACAACSWAWPTFRCWGKP